MYMSNYYVAYYVAYYVYYTIIIMMRDDVTDDVIALDCSQPVTAISYVNLGWNRFHNYHIALPQYSNGQPGTV